MFQFYIRFYITIEENKSFKNNDKDSELTITNFPFKIGIKQKKKKTFNCCIIFNVFKFYF